MDATPRRLKPRGPQPTTSLLDLPDSLLIDLLSRKHCDSSTSRSAATTCWDLRHAALSSVTLCHADLDSAAASQVLAFARSLPALRRMQLTGLDTDLSAAELRTLAALTRLHHCELEGANELRRAPADWSALAALTGLRSLKLAGCGVSDTTATIVSNLHHLQTASFEHNFITNAGLWSLADSPLLRSLNLSHNLVSPDLVYSGSTGALTRLELAGNMVGDTGAAAVACLTSLRRLGFWECELEDTGAAALTVLTALTNLDLNHNVMSAAGTRCVASLTGLSSLASALPSVLRKRHKVPENA